MLPVFFNTKVEYMDLTYQVPRDAYVALLADMIRQNERRPLRIFTGLLLTVGQMAVVIWLCLTRLEPGQRTFFLIWSALLAGLTVLRRATVRLRAKGTLQRLEYNGQLPADYWKKHHLQVDEQLRLTYGDQELTCPLYGVSRIEQKDGALYIYCGSSMFDIVPLAAFRSEKAMEKWAEKLRAMTAQAKAPQPQEGEALAGLTDGVSWSMPERDFEDGQFLAYRTLYYRYRFLRTATFVRLAVSVAAVIAIMSNRTPVNIALCAAILLLANLENISMVPFICRARIRRETGQWKGSREYRLAMEDGTLTYVSDKAECRIPIDKINLCQQLGSYYVVAWNNFPAVVMPMEIAETAAAPLLEQIKALHPGQ